MITARLNGVNYVVQTCKTVEEGLSLLGSFARFSHRNYDEAMKIRFYYFTDTQGQD